ncbi:MAG: ParB/RepB/Spo0J family partition protein [Hyphomicrobium sp.]
MTNSKTHKANTKSPKPIQSAEIITLSAPPVQIPLDKLELSENNVRRVKAGLTIEGLADSIARRTLLQSLSVRAKLGENGEPTGTYDVQAGGRRLRALQLLARQGRIPKDAPIPCIVKVGGITEDDSLAENAHREDLHPIDQFRAFAALRDRDMSIDDIAAAYRVTPAFVKQLLRLDSASEKLLKAYEDDEIDLEQLKAFCVTDDHKRQNEVLKLITKGNAYGSAHNIRKLLTENTIPAKDRRVRLVGLKSYTKAGGTIMRDLFETDDGGYLQNPEILTRLLNEKLAEAQSAISAEGWKWVEISLDPHLWELKRSLRQLPDSARLSPKDLAKRIELAAQYDALIEELDDDNETAEADQARLDSLEAKIDAIDAKPPHYSPETKAIAGAILYITNEGKLATEYGYVRPEDMPQDPDAPDQGSTRSSSDKPAEYVVAGKPLTDKLVHDLTAFRTVAIRNALAQNFSAAFTTALHAMCLDVFHRGSSHSCAQISVRESFAMSVPGLGEYAASKDIETRHDEWQTRLPQDEEDLWHYIGNLSDTDRAALFAHCVSLTINAVRGSHDTRQSERHHADQLCNALSLDIAATGWTTNAENYFKRVNKLQIIESVREAKGERGVALIERLKHGEMAEEAARLLEDTNWLPPVLRSAVPVPQAAVAAEAGTDESAAPATALPAFLATDPAGTPPAAAA